MRICDLLNFQYRFGNTGPVVAFVGIDVSLDAKWHIDRKGFMELSHTHFVEKEKEVGWDGVDRMLLTPSTAPPIDTRLLRLDMYDVITPAVSTSTNISPPTPASFLSDSSFVYQFSTANKPFEQSGVKSHHTRWKQRAEIANITGHDAEFVEDWTVQVCIPPLDICTLP